MRRLVFVCLFILASVVTWAPGIAAQNGGLPKAPQSEGDDLAFSVVAAIIGESLGEPLNLKPTSNGDRYLLVTLHVENTGSSTKLLDSDRFTIADGRERIRADAQLGRAADDLDLKAMGASPDRLDANDDQNYLLGWQVAPDLDEFILSIDYGDADTIDLQPWLDLDIEVTELVPSTDRSSATTQDDDEDATPSRRATTTPRATATPNASRITPAERSYITSVDSQQVVLYSSVVRAATLLSNASDNPSLFRTDSWILDLAVELSTWQTVYSNAQDLSPSDRQQSIQDVWLELSGLTSEAADDIAYSIDNLDASFLQTGLAKIQQADDLVPVLTGLIKDFEDDPASFTASAPTTSTSPGQTVSDCSPFADYDEAQAYYADHPDAQPIIDPDFDGQACEVYFGRG